MEIFVWSTIGLVVLALFIAGSRVQTTEKVSSKLHEEAARLAREREIEQAMTRPIVPVPNPGIVLSHPKEVVLWHGPASLFGQTTAKTYVSGSSSISFRVAKGVRVRTGGSRGHVETQRNWEVIDHGQMIFTSERLVYIGTTQSKEFEIKKMLTLEVLSDGVTMHPKRGKPMTFRIDSLEGPIILRRLVSGDTNGHTTPAEQDDPHTIHVTLSELPGHSTISQPSE